MKIRSALLLGAAALTNPVVAYAEESKDERREIIVTGQKIPDAASGATGAPVLIRDVPQGISVITEEVFDIQQPLSLTDIIRNSPSIGGFRNSSENFRSFSVRGFTQNETTTDGLRNTDALNIQPDGLASIERIEVVRGPSAALYGRGSLGGAINIVTKKPLNAPQARIDIVGGTRQFLSGAADITGPIVGNLSGRIIAGYEHRDSFIDFTPIRSLQVAPSLGVTTGDTRALFQLDYRERRQIRYIGLPLYGTIRGLNDIKLRQGLNFGEPSLPEARNTGLQVTGSLEHDIRDNWSVRVAGRYTSNTFDQQAVALRTLGADNRTLSRSWNRFDEKQDEQAVFLSSNISFDTGNIDHEVRVGFEHAQFTYDSVFFSGRIASINIASPVYGAQPTGIFVLDDTTDKIRGMAISFQDQITLTPQFKILIGGRYDWIDTRRISNISPSAGRRTTGAFTPRVGATFDATESVTLYASWGRNIESQNNGGSNATLTPFRPVRGEQYEGGVKISINDRVAGSLGAYRINADGVLTADPASFFSIQTGKRRSQGIEAELNLQPVAGLTLSGYATYTDAEILFDTRLPTGTPIQNVPKYAARLFALYEVQEGDFAGLSLNTAVTYAGQQFGNLAAVATRYTVPDSTVVDAGIGYTTGPVRFGLQARNLLNQSHFIRGAFDGRNIVPGDPRSIIFSIGYRWGGKKQ